METRTPARRILQPRKPSGKTRVTKRRTHIPYVPRDERLTADQQKWAHSLTVSLSGYAARRTFLAALLHTKPTEQNPTQAPYSLDPPALAQKAAAAAAAKWARKARLMHEAGSGAKKIVAWDPVTEQYLQAYASEDELTEATTKAAAKEGKQRRSRRYSTIDSENSAIADVNVPTSPPPLSPPLHRPCPRPRLHSPVPLPPPPPIPDWRTQARRSIQRKKLALSRAWSAATWTQKSSVHERLLLLEESGFDIRELRERGRRPSSCEEAEDCALECWDEGGSACVHSHMQKKGKYDVY